MRQALPGAENRRFHSSVIRPIIAKLIQISADAATLSYKESRSKSLGQGKESHVAGNYLACRKDPYRLTRVLKRWLVLLLVLAFSTSGLAHVPMGDHAASATPPSLEVASIGQAVIAEQDCGGNAHEAHGPTCCTGSVCSYFIPPVSAGGTSMATVAETVAPLPVEVHPGRAPSPGLRPPSLSANV